MEFFTSIIDYCCKDEISDSKSILGMTFTKEGKIISVTENSIAEKSGLIMNDIIIAIAGMDIQVTEPEIITKLLPYGRELVIDFTRDSEKFEAIFELTEKDVANL